MPGEIGDAGQKVTMATDVTKSYHYHITKGQVGRQGRAGIAGNPGDKVIDDLYNYLIRIRNCCRERKVILE